MSDILTIERTELESEINPIVAAAQSIQVVDAESYTKALELGKACATRIKLVEEKLGPAKRRTWEAYQEVMKLMKSFTDPLEAAKKLVSGRAYVWQVAEEERKRKEAEAARLKTEEEAERKRKEEEEKRIALAERLTEKGMKEQADELMAEPIIVTVDNPPPPPPKVIVQGTSTRENWQFKIIDASLIPREYLIPDSVKIGKIVKALKGETKIPGIQVFDAGTVAFRA